MLIDINAYIGHWAFRQLRYNTAETLVRLMDKNKIEKAIVASINGTMYKNVHSANEEIAVETKLFRDRLIPFATLNPTWAGWKDDLKKCAEDLRLNGLRLYPQYHGYSITDSIALEIIDAATELNWAIQIPMTLVDRRQKHKWDLAEDIPPADFEKLVSLRPNAKFMFLNSFGINPDNLPKTSRYLIDIANPYYQTLLRKEIPKLIDRAGAEHLAFGTNMPFRIPEATLLKLNLIEIKSEDKEKIAYNNAENFLKK